MTRIKVINQSDIPATLHTPGAYGQWSVFDPNSDKQLAILRIWDLVALVRPIRSWVIATSSTLVKCWNFFGGPRVGLMR